MPSDAHALPHSYTLLSSLIQKLDNEINPTTSSSEDENVRSWLSPEPRSLFVTLHCLLPNETLSALNILDQRLITLLRLDSTDLGTHIGDDARLQPQDASSQSVAEVYYIRPEQVSQRGQGRAQGPVHQVRLQAWHCTCPAFTYSLYSRPTDEVVQESVCTTNMFGSLAGSTDSLAICKHLLACVLAKHVRAFESHVEVREVSVAEMVASEAGWQL